jgi:hypothetical protein
MTRTSSVALCLLLAASPLAAPAQTPPAPDAEAPPPDRDRAIVGGKHLQPHAPPGEAGKSPETEIHLLQKGAKEAPANEPPVVPRDLYGNPLGGNPGLNPPGLGTAPAQPKP